MKLNIKWMLSLVLVLFPSSQNQKEGPQSVPVDNIDNILFVDGVKYAQRPDLGVGINAAYSALPATGGEIIVPPGVYDMATSVRLTTPGKPALIECAPGKATYIGWRGSRSTSVFTFDSRSGTNSHPAGYGLRGCYLQTSGRNTGAAVELGNSNSAEGALVEDSTLIGFGDGIKIDGGGYPSFNISLSRTSVISATNCIDVGPDSSGVEHTKINDGQCIASDNGIHISGRSNTSDVTAVSWSCDGPTNWCVVMDGITGSAVTLVGPHLENPGLGFPLYADVRAGTLSIFGGQAADDVTRGKYGKPWFAVNPSGAIFADGLQVASSGRTTTVPIFDLGGAGRLFSQISVSTPEYFTGMTAVYPASSLAAKHVIDESSVGSDLGLAVPVLNVASQYEVKGINGQIAFVASFTTSAAATDHVTIPGITAASHCSISPTNDTAANDSPRTYIFAKSYDQITMAHPPNSGRTWDILCTAN